MTILYSICLKFLHACEKKNRSVTNRVISIEREVKFSLIFRLFSFIETFCLFTIFPALLISRFAHNQSASYRNSLEPRLWELDTVLLKKLSLSRCKLSVFWFTQRYTADVVFTFKVNEWNRNKSQSRRDSCGNHIERIFFFSIKIAIKWLPEVIVKKVKGLPLF